MVAAGLIRVLLSLVTRLGPIHIQRLPRSVYGVVAGECSVYSFSGFFPGLVSLFIFPLATCKRFLVFPERRDVER